MNLVEQQLIESLDTFKDLFDHAHELIHIVHLDGSIIYVNRAWKKRLEYSLEEVYGHNILEVISKEDHAIFKDYRQKIISGELKDQPIIVNFQTKSGARITMEGVINLKKQQHNISYTRGLFNDISVRIQNEKQLIRVNQQLKEREANLHQLLLNAPDAVIVIDDGGIIIFWNPRAATLFGWSAEEALGRPLVDTIVPVQHKADHKRGMDRYLKTGISHILNKTTEITAVNKEGTEFYISLTLSVTSQNDKLAFIGFIRDIDSEKRIALELDEKRKELEATNRELEQFAYVASHDLQEPLRKIRFYTDMVLTQTELQEDQRNKIKKANESAQRMSQLIHGLLEYSRLSQTNVFFEKTDLDLIVKNILSDFELLIGQKKANVHCDVLPVIEAIPVQMNQLFNNLISNSLKFTKRNTTPQINISVKSIPADQINESNLLITGKQYVEISLRDNGIGFSEEYADKIFGIFQRLNDYSQYQGYGIGLAVCKKIVENHRGIILAAGSPNGGATFQIILPVTQD